MLEAYDPVTTYYTPNDTSNPWTSLVVTETIVTQFITYENNGTIDGTTSELKTVNQTKTTVLGETNQTITHSTPTFAIHPTPGAVLYVDAGPTYVIYSKLIGGLDKPYDQVFSLRTAPYCGNTLTTVQDYSPTKSEDWSNFIATYTGTAPSRVNGPIALPSKLIDFLKSDPAIGDQFHGSDIATCTLRPTQFLNIGPNPAGSRVPAHPTAAPFPMSLAIPEMPPEIPETPSVTTGIFLSTTYASTSTHITRQGCLRCVNTNSFVKSIPTPTSNGEGNIHNDPKAEQPSQHPPGNQPNDNPNNQAQQPQSPSITIGDQVFPVTTPQSAQHDSNGNNNNQPPPILIIGSETFHPGETRTINNIAVIAPTAMANNGNPDIIVNGHPIPYNPVSHPAPALLTLGSTTLTANPQGEFVLGTATLSPGGPAIVLSGTTVSLSGSTNTPVAMINGVPQALNAAPTPRLRLPNGATIPMTTLNAVPAYIFADGETLTLGGALTVAGTTFSLPAIGSGTVVVLAANGQTTTTLALGAQITAPPPLTINNAVYTASIRDGTTAYVLAPGATLTRGGAVTLGASMVVSLDAGGTAVVINGVTSRVVIAAPAMATGTTVTAGKDTGDFIASGIGGSGDKGSGSGGKGSGSGVGKSSSAGPRLEHGLGGSVVCGWVSSLCLFFYLIL